MKNILVTKALLPPYEEYCEMIKPLWESHWLTNMGEYHQQLEKELKKYLQAERLSLFCNGHMALELVLQAMGLEGEVITTPFTFVSTTHAIVRNGLTPVFCDIEKDTYTIDVDKIEELITDKTCAILPVHVYGNMCNVEKIEEIAKKHHLKVIYDAAHAFGVTYKGNPAGNFGDASMFSFHATKVYNTIEGGAVVFSDKELEEKLYWLKNFGIESEEDITYIGSNAKMNEFAAVMGLCNLKQIEWAIKERKRVYEQYRKYLENVSGIKLCHVKKEQESNYSYMPILVEKEFGQDRNQVYDKLKEKGIFARKYFYPITNKLECYGMKFNRGNTPIAEYVSENILTLPIEPLLQNDEIEWICKTLLER